MQEDNYLEKYDLKSWFKSCLMGFFIGIGIIVPGVSGAQISIIFKLYDKLTYAISNIFKKFLYCLLFLLPVIIGIIIGFILGFFTIKQLLNLSTIILVCLFAGMMTGGIKSVLNEIKESQISINKILLLILGLIIPISISIISIYSNLSLESQLTNSSWWYYIVIFIIGILVGFTQIIPGLSATSLLMSFGIYTPLVNSISITYWKQNPMIFISYFLLIIGFLLGIFTISKCVSYFLKNFRTSFYYFVLGLTVSSIASMFYNPEILTTYKNFSTYLWETKFYLEISLSPIIFIIGFIIVYLFIYFSNKNKKV